MDGVSNTFADHVMGRVPAAPGERFSYAAVDDPSAAYAAEVAGRDAQAGRARLAWAQQRLAASAPAAAVLDMCDMGRTFLDLAYYYGQFGVMDDRRATYERFSEQVLLPSVRVSHAYMSRKQQQLLVQQQQPLHAAAGPGETNRPPAHHVHNNPEPEGDP